MKPFRIRTTFESGATEEEYFDAPNEAMALAMAALDSCHNQVSSSPVKSIEILK